MFGNVCSNYFKIVGKFMKAKVNTIYDINKVKNFCAFLNSSLGKIFVTNMADRVNILFHTNAHMCVRIYTYICMYIYLHIHTYIEADRTNLKVQQLNDINRI